MFRIVQTGKTRGDGTAPFDVILYQETTVRKFLQEILAAPDDWGYIRIEKGLPFASAPCCPYEHGKLLPDAYIPFDEADMDRFIVSATADGGMGRMDYWLTLQEKEPVSGSFYFLLLVLRLRANERHNRQDDANSPDCHTGTGRDDVEADKGSAAKHTDRQDGEGNENLFCHSDFPPISKPGRCGRGCEVYRWAACQGSRTQFSRQRGRPPLPRFPGAGNTGRQCRFSG